ncbi:hypothetical protein AA313_de0201471 [Arthrobotrys entomopaga]|nr:hypothetical protein AA313_de0201471 [Arthrobotrys entomopaga]
MKPSRRLQTNDTSGDSDSEELATISADEITVAIFCALSCESVAVVHSLDEEFQCRPKSRAQKYILHFGRIGEHKIVIARPTQIGKVSTAQLASKISQQFPNVRFALMIGIGAGIPRKRDIRLGDIAVSIPREGHPGVLEYDFGKSKKNGFIPKGCLSKPPPILLSADGQLEDDERIGRRPLRKILKKIVNKPGYGRPKVDDILFESTFDHINEGGDCSGCEASSQKKIVYRGPREKETDGPVVHRGLILSGGFVVKNPEDRDRLRRGQDDAICYEMEAAGIMDEIPCLVIRGISDYGDTHKQDAWHCYAAAVAAAYGKAILRRVDGEELEETTRMGELLEQVDIKVEAIQKDVSKLQRKVYNTYEETKRTEILEWLYPREASSRHNTVISARQAGTGKWFLAQTVVSQWLAPSTNSSKILWCYGIPGAGKSTISSVVIDHLEELQAQDTTTQVAVAYYYFDFSNEEIDTRKFTRMLLKQLVFQSPKLPQRLTELFKSHSGSGKAEIEDQKIEDLFIQTASQFETTYIVVDALDECAQEQRLRVLEILQRFADANVRIFATSRPHPQDINEIFKDAGKIELGARADDIRKYVEAEIKRYHTRVPKAKHIHDELKDRIIDGLVQKAHGM